MCLLCIINTMTDGILSPSPILLGDGSLAQDHIVLDQDHDQILERVFS